jgi:hypothetical protein
MPAHVTNLRKAMWIAPFARFDPRLNIAKGFFPFPSEFLPSCREEEKTRPVAEFRGTATKPVLDGLSSSPDESRESEPEHGVCFSSLMT